MKLLIMQIIKKLKKIKICLLIKINIIQSSYLNNNNINETN